MTRFETAASTLTHDRSGSVSLSSKWYNVKRPQITRWEPSVFG